MPQRCALDGLSKRVQDEATEAVGELLDRFRRFVLMVVYRAVDFDTPPGTDGADSTQIAFFRAKGDFGKVYGATEAQFFARFTRILIKWLSSNAYYFQREQTDR